MNYISKTFKNYVSVVFILSIVTTAIKAELPAPQLTAPQLKVQPKLRIAPGTSSVPQLGQKAFEGALSKADEEIAAKNLSEVGNIGAAVASVFEKNSVITTHFNNLPEENKKQIANAIAENPDLSPTKLIVSAVVGQDVEEAIEFATTTVNTSDMSSQERVLAQFPEAANLPSNTLYEMAPVIDNALKGSAYVSSMSVGAYLAAVTRAADAAVKILVTDDSGREFISQVIAGIGTTADETLNALNNLGVIGGIVVAATDPTAHTIDVTSEGLLDVTHRCAARNVNLNRFTCSDGQCTINN